jgi:hypothetical protein
MQTLGHTPARPRKIIFFGAGEAGRQMLRIWPADRPVAYVADNDPAKWGGTLDGVPIVSPRTLEAEPFDRALVVITSERYQEIAQQLEDIGLIEGHDFAWPGEALNMLTRPVAAGPSDGPVVLHLEEHWFGIDYTGLAAECARAGIRYVPARRVRRLPTARIAVDTRSYRSVKYQSVPLYEACVFDICVACRVTADRIDPTNPAHWLAIEEHLQCAAACARIATKALDDEQPDLLVIAQGHGTEAAVYRYAAVLRGIRVLALENSLNQSRLVWDDVAGIAVNKIPARNYYWRWADLVDRAAAVEHVQRFLACIKQVKSADHASPQTSWSGPVGARRRVLYLSNVLTDSSVLFNSRAGSQIEAIKATARWALANDCTFVLKCHPLERSGNPGKRRGMPPAMLSYDGLTVRALREDRAFWDLVTQSGHCVIDAENEFDTYGLIRQSDVCVTICSQAGLEALMLGKEVVLLGDAYYGGLGFTHDVQALTHLGQTLATALSPSGRRADPDNVAAFFYVFDQIYCVEKSGDGLAALITRTLGRARLPTLPQLAGVHA